MSFMLCAYIIDHGLCLYGFIQCFVFGFDYLESMQPKFSCWTYCAIYVFIMLVFIGSQVRMINLLLIIIVVILYDCWKFDQVALILIMSSFT